MRPRVSVGLLIAALLTGVFAVPAGALPRRSGPATRLSPPPAEEHVAALDDFFLPSLVEIRRGGMVTWDFTGTRTHTATDATGMHLYDSDLVPPGGPSFSYTFPAAGSYAFSCTIHVGMRGHIDVPMRVSPVSGTTSATFHVRWASKDAPAGFVFDVRMTTAGQPWLLWRDGVTIPNGTFRPEGGGAVRFQSRLRELATGARSEWSPPVKIRVR